MSTPYRTAAPVYRSKGWRNIIPIGYGRPREKTPPVKGYTGREALAVDGVQVEAWRNEMPSSNIAIVMSNMVALDVDGPEGQQVLDQLAEKLGALPPTFSSTSRGPDSLRRHYFYRIPVTLILARLEGVLRKLYGDKLDVVHRHHRYALVAPSVHPDGGTYAWYGPDGSPCAAPSPDDVPDLPAAWCDYFAGLLAPATAKHDDFFDAAADFTGDHKMTHDQVGEAWRKAVARFLEKFTDGNKNNAIRDLAFESHHYGLEPSDVADVVLTHGKGRFGWTSLDAEDIGTIERARADAEAQGQWVAEIVPEGSRESASTADSARLKVGSAAEMAYWLEANAGKGRLSGFFSRNGIMVHTPRVNELGYVPATEGGNGPVEIRPVSGPVLAAKLQYLFRCYKVIKDPEDKDAFKEVDALFPQAAASVAVEAPEALQELRPLKGITSTPMIRPDGSLLSVPGYDVASGFLFLPGEGVNVPEVPDKPTAGDVEAARELLLGMIQDFPFATPDDRANYLGLLLTPLLRQVTPPSYKLFGIGAHQPGSGKSLLAELAGIIHGSVMRSEVPEDEAEWRKQTFAILSQTSMPVVVLDNIMGVLKSSTLAGILTAGREVTDRELGTSKTITVANDRVWVVTGNNLSLGGDMVRRTITILIDPDTPNPERRTDFRVGDLKAWAAENRNQIIWALLVLIRAWVAAGMPEKARQQSDSFARWERVVDGVLGVAGVEGAFDAESGRKAAAGGDDDGLFQLLDVLESRFGAKVWRAGEALEPKADEGQWLMESRDWLPAIVLEKLGRSEAGGRKSFGRWLQNRAGRWVTSEERSLVLRAEGKDRLGQIWRIEQR